MSFKLVLFDIDGTLLHSGGAGRRGMNKTFKDLYNIDGALNEVALAGRTDELIFMDAAARHGIQIENGSLNQFKNQYFKNLAYEITANSPQKHLFPGVRQLLEMVQMEPTLVCGLLTGNWEKSGFFKLKAFGIDHFFELGAFADDSSDRNKLVPFAVERMVQLKQQKPEPRQVFVIGDTPKDVECAKVHDVVSVAVATTHEKEILAKAEPDYLVSDFSDLDKMMEIFL